MRRFHQSAMALALLGGLLAGCATTTQTGTAPAAGGPTRSIVLHHTESDESLSVTFQRDGVFDPDAMIAINTLFRDRRSGEETVIDPQLIGFLADLRDRLELPGDTPINLTSCYRSRATNVALARTNGNVAENSYHMRGQAVDFHIPGVPLKRIAEEAAALGRGGYAQYAAHVHIDTGPFRTWSTGGNRERRTWVEARSSSTTRSLALRTVPDKKGKPAVTAAAKPAQAKPTQAKEPGKKPAKAQARTVVALADTPAPAPRKPARK